ncbi:MAG: Mth938-like domain-containing protein [Comamonadaceae bacterium]|nr:Mth938-like domain-containing protein [Comamonadaceae bacterium]
MNETASGSSTASRTRSPATATATSRSTDQRYEASLVLLPDRIAPDWVRGGFAALTEADLRRLLDFRPELVLLGTGARQRFPQPALLRPLIEARIGFEVMDLQAACRTYNILMGEGRRVAAALLFD